MDLNRAQIIGNVTRDVELRNTSSGQSVCSFGVATNQQWTDQQGQKQQRTEFHNVVAWAKLAEICSQYLAKGRKVYVEGRLQTRDWETQDGQKRRTTEIIAENMIMLDRGPSAGAPSAAPAPAVPSGPTLEPILDKGIGGAENEIRVEDIPF